MEYNNIFDKIESNLKSNPDKIALRYKYSETGSWRNISWRTFNSQILNVAYGLKEEGIVVGQNVGIFSINIPEWTIADLAILKNGAISVPIHVKTSVEQLEKIINHAELEVIFTGNQEQYYLACLLLDKCTKLRKIIALDNDTVIRKDDSSIYFRDILKIGAASSLTNSLDYKIDLNDIATIVYDTKSFDSLKGSMISYKNVVFSLNELNAKFKVNEEDSFVCFQNLSVIQERLWVYYCLLHNVTISYNVNPKEILFTIKNISPSILSVSSKLLENIYNGVQTKFKKRTNGQQRVIKWAFRVGKKYHLKRKRLNKRIFPLLALKYYLANKWVFKGIKELLGDNLKILVCMSGSDLSVEVFEFFKSTGFNFTVGFGCNESTGIATFIDKSGYEIGSVGTKYPNIDVSVNLGSSQIQIKGENVINGYYKNSEETSKNFTNGWFKSQHKGKFSENNNLFIYKEQDLD